MGLRRLQEYAPKIYEMSYLMLGVGGFKITECERNGMLLYALFMTEGNQSRLGLARQQNSLDRTYQVFLMV